jgi:hypothetical protein
MDAGLPANWPRARFAERFSLPGGARQAQRRRFGAALSLLVLAVSGATPASTYLEGADSLRQREAAQSLARTSSRHLLIEVGGDWCAWCRTLDALLERDPQLAERWQEAFVVLKLAASEEHTPPPALHGLPATDGYPYFFVLDPDGRLLHAADGRVFYADGDYAASRVAAFIERWGSRHD